MTSLPGVLVGHPIVPVVVIDDAAIAVPAAEALVAGGIGCIEVTLRTSAGLAAIEALQSTEIVVGAGTVLTPEDVDRVADAGARFIVTPGFAPDVVARALERGLDVLPGVATATEVQAALRTGLGAVKLFPADRLGGIDMISALAGPFPTTAFVPSGGVSAANLRAYLSHPNVPAVSGSWMIGRALLRDHDFAAIERLSREASAEARSIVDAP
jgi:2-dehydro-3-deoxyphosphogluconate aldolase/(4S)-4-hydroxy-2-oxoglutarate aldolase